jgi:hypothetical protein
MSKEILSLAILEPVAGKEEECVKFLLEFYSVLRQKGYSRDLLYRDSKHESRLLNLRYWASEEMRREAQHDPDVHRYWQRLPDVCAISSIYETLEEIEDL